MSIRLDLDWCHGLADSHVEKTEEGAVTLSLSHGQEQLRVHLSLPSLEALWLTLTLALSSIKRC